MIIDYAIFPTELGRMGVAKSSSGLIAVTIPHKSEEDVRIELKFELEERWKKAQRKKRRETFELREGQSNFEEIISTFQRYFLGERIEFDYPLDFYEATQFQKEVWQTARKIPYGETRSYGWIAKQIGRPRASRAVGSAMASNPLPLIVPCHRVIAGGGKIGGFSSGLEWKRRLLSLEGVNIE